MERPARCAGDVVAPHAFRELDDRRAAAPRSHAVSGDRAKGARGHSLLRAATDTEIEVADRVISVTKQRDLDGSFERGFELDVVTRDRVRETAANVRIHRAEAGSDALRTGKLRWPTF